MASEENNKNENISINGKKLMLGVLEKDGNYQMYLHQGMSVEEIMFDVMVVIRLLEQDNYCKCDEFLDNVKKMYEDPQYEPLTAEEIKKLEEGKENEEH